MNKKILTFEGAVEKRQKPKNLKQEDFYLFEHEFEKKIKDSFVFPVKNLYISNKNIFNIKKLKLYFAETYMNNPTFRNFIKVLLRFINLSKHSQETFGSGVWVINNKSENYFHWMTESLSRVLSFKKINKNSKILLPETFNNLEFVGRTLDLLKVEYEFYKNNDVLKVENL